VPDSHKLLNNGETSMFPLCTGGKSAMCWKGDRPLLVCMNSDDAV